MGASKFSKIFQQDFYDFGEFPPHFELIFRRGEAGGAKVMPHQQKVAGGGGEMLPWLLTDGE